MNVAASMALAVAERVERTGGARAGLVAWKTLAGNATDVDLRARALLAALRCALALRDIEALGELTTQWASIDRGVWDTPIVVLCIEMERADLLPRALALADVEARRHRTARALYCRARCLDVARDAGAARAFRETIERADKEGATDIHLAASVRLATILARSWDTMTEALEVAERVDPKRVAPASRLAIANVLLRSPSRFTRAAALGLLDELVTDADSGAALRALALAARWVDAAGGALTPLEADRLRALFGRERATKLAPRGQDVVRRIEAIAVAKDDVMLTRALADAARVAPDLAPIHARARDVVAARFEVLADDRGPTPSAMSARHARRWDELLDVVVALRDGPPARAARGLRVLAEVEASELPDASLAAAERALAHEDAAVREAAVLLVEAHLRRGPVGAAPRGWLRLADALALLGRSEASLRARRAAVVAREPGAAESLSTSLAREGWELARAGDRAGAIARLVEAKALLSDQGTSMSNSRPT